MRRTDQSHPCKHQNQDLKMHKLSIFRNIIKLISEEVSHQSFATKMRRIKQIIIEISIESQSHHLIGNIKLL